MIQFLVHDKKDNVGVAVQDIPAGQNAVGRYLDSQKEIAVGVGMDVPLGHKIALKPFKAGDTVIKYGHDIGKVVAAIQVGEHVHVHNLKTKRW